MSIKEFVKIKILNFLESSMRLGKFKNTQLGKKVLLVGDGISSAYAKDIFKEYNSIIVCNNAIQNIQLEGCNIIFHIIMEPDLLIPNKHPVMRKIFKEAIDFFPRTLVILNPIGRFFNFFSSRYRNALYLSPYRKLLKDNDVVYQDYTAAFQATLGMALHCGFQEIHCIGFDAWLLTPKNNLRWYSDSMDPTSQDSNQESKPETFILNASKLANLKVYTFMHYTSRFDFIEGIELKSTGYVPARDRVNLMQIGFQKKMSSWENKYFPKGYVGDKPTV